MFQNSLEFGIPVYLGPYFKRFAIDWYLGLGVYLASCGRYRLHKIWIGLKKPTNVIIVNVYIPYTTRLVETVDAGNSTFNIRRDLLARQTHTTLNGVYDATCMKCIPRELSHPQTTGNIRRDLLVLYTMSTTTLVAPKISTFRYIWINCKKKYPNETNDEEMRYF